jgi:dGTPase
MPKYEILSKELTIKIERDLQGQDYPKLGFDEKNILRRTAEEGSGAFWITPFIRDIDKIMHSPYFSRYADKTQVYSLFKNDDMTRRSLHVQLVSRIARSIGKALHLNLDLIEAIALGHDVGHPAFAHTGEHLLDELYSANTGRRFLHNIHSVRVLDKMHPYNLSLQVLNGIAAHNGELELAEYHPVPVKDFAEFDAIMERCCIDRAFADKIMPCTLEGAVVRISDIIAYLGKDRQDAILAKAITATEFSEAEIGTVNSEIVNNLIVNVIENSYGKPYIKLDDKHFQALKRAKAENYEKIYNRAGKVTGTEGIVKPMMQNVYGQLLDDVRSGNTSSPIFRHHILPQSQCMEGYEKTEVNQLVVDYIASMTDDYFIELHQLLFPTSDLHLCYHGYFEDIK